MKKIIAKLQNYLSQKKFKRLLQKNKWEGLIPGDVVEYKDKKLMYRGINKHGGPGMPEFPEPMFGSADPNEPGCIYYLRPTGKMFPETVFGESAPPVKALSTGISIGFLNATRSEFKKIGHITPEQWKSMATA
jgi:hypothetical protein